MTDSGFLSDYIADLAGLTTHNQAAQEAEQQTRAQQAEQEARDRMTPLEQRLKALLRDVPESLQSEGLSLPVIQTMLRGRWRGNAHPGDVGRALRHLGFTRTRRWRGESIGFQALWVKQP
jgi:hypothetical protein